MKTTNPQAKPLTIRYKESWCLTDSLMDLFCGLRSCAGDGSLKGVGVSINRSVYVKTDCSVLQNPTPLWNFLSAWLGLIGTKNVVYDHPSLSFLTH